MNDLEKLITGFGGLCYIMGIGVERKDKRLEEKNKQFAQQAKQNLLNYIEQNYERKK